MFSAVLTHRQLIKPQNSIEDKKILSKGLATYTHSHTHTPVVFFSVPEDSAVALQRGEEELTVLLAGQQVPQTCETRVLHLSQNRYA